MIRDLAEKRPEDDVMKYGMLLAASLAFIVGSTRESAAELECVEFASQETLCDDGLTMYYRAAPSASFMILNDAMRTRVINYLASQAGGAASGSGNGETSFFGSSGSVTSLGDCVSVTAPGVNFMGSGC
jgi:hypothetical protein